jgi:lipopolysaccharide/colanic/teichoic acid biosynthesis glycosyltransferase
MVPRAAESPIHEEFVRAFISGDLAPAPDGEATYKLAADPRVTRIGQALRASSLDELPQLFDVLRGTMSFVGPRPLPAYEVAAFDGRYHERLAALPGISGLWQIDGRGRVPFEQMMQMDIDYVRRQSLRLDGMLLVRTVPAVLSRRGAR